MHGPSAVHGPQPGRGRRTRPPRAPTTCAGRSSSSTTAFAQTEARLAEFTATRKVIDGFAPPATHSALAESATVHLRIVTAFNEHLGLPTDEPSVNVTHSRLGRLVRQGLLEQPGRGRYQKRT